MGHGAESGVVMEATPSAAFEVVQAEFLLHLVVVALNAPAQLGQAHQSARGRVSWEGREPEFRGRLLPLGPLA